MLSDQEVPDFAVDERKPIRADLSSEPRWLIMCTLIGGLGTCGLGVYTLIKVTSPIRCYLGVLFTLFGINMSQITMRPKSDWSNRIIWYYPCFGSDQGKSLLCAITGGLVMVTAEIVDHGVLFFIGGLNLILIAIAIRVTSSWLYR